MNCANHVDVPAVAYCRTCGKPLCTSCVRDIRGVIYCEECLASHLSGAMPPPGATAVPPVAQPVVDAPNPRLAALLGFIPGVGAMYNGEYAKGFVHVLIFATLIWMAAHVNGIFGLGIAAFVIYMPIEAYQTARARAMGLPAPDPLGLNMLLSSAGAPAPHAATNVSAVPVAGGNPGAPIEGEPVEDAGASKIPIGAFVLIGLGVLFLLNEMDVVNFDRLWRFWPLVLIAVGVRVLMRRRGMGW
jgi:hypothetical protein